MRSISKLVFETLWIFSGQFSFAQEYPFINYTPKDGLVSSRVQKFYQDSKGRIFFMTGNGLSLYDGARFLNYSIDDGLASPLINDVLEINADSILVATNTGVLNAWVKGSIKTIKTRNGYCPVINKFLRDQANVIYAATDQGLFRFDKDIFIPIPISFNQNEIACNLVDIFAIGNHFLLKKFDAKYISYDLVLVNKYTGVISSFLKGMAITCVLPVTAGNLLLVIADYKLLSFDLDAAGKGVFRQINLPPPYLSLEPFILIKIILDRNNNMWAIADKAILRCSPDGDIQSFDRSNGLVLNNIVSLAVDRENILWILSDGSGVVKLVNRNVRLITGQIGKSPATFTAIYTDDSGNVWLFNAEDKRLYCQGRDGLKSWQMDSTLNVYNIGSRSGRLLLFSGDEIFEAGLSKKTNRFAVRKIYQHVNDSINFTRAETDQNGNIYLPGHILAVLTPSGRVFKTDVPGFIDWITFDQQQQLWTITRNGFLLCFQWQPKPTGNPLILKFQYKVKMGDPRSIAVDKEGKVWIGTRFSGLYCLEFNNRKLISQRHWSTTELLSDNFIYYLTCDKNNVIWAGTQSGIDKISFSGKVVESITRNNNIYQMIYKIQLGKNSDLWAIGSGGVVHIQDENPEEVHYQPQLQIMRMIAGDKVLGLPSGRTVLPSQTRQVSFEIAAPSFIDEKRIAYSYRLDGRQEEEWSRATNQAGFHLINLQPGEYTLHMKAFFPVSKYRTEELMYHFIILPPWWKAWWFYWLLAAIFIGTLVLFTRMYYQKKLQKQEVNFERQRAIELERTRIAMEMHDDLGSGLTSIRYLAAGLATSAPTVVKEKAIKIESSAKQLVDSMNDIVWTLKSDNNLLSDTLNYIRKQAGELLESFGMEYRLNFPMQLDEIKLTNEQKRNLILISKEAVHNGIKHSDATILTVKAVQDNGVLRLVFSDNGKGFTQEPGTMQGNGLHNMKRRAAEIGASIQMVQDSGTTIILTMKLG
jgi:signal transduction histidine kinase/ligand-binding sensor domain-containing protein